MFIRQLINCSSSDSLRSTSEPTFGRRTKTDFGFFSDSVHRMLLLPFCNREPDPGHRRRPTLRNSAPKCFLKPLNGFRWNPDSEFHLNFSYSLKSRRAAWRFPSFKRTLFGSFLKRKQNSEELSERSSQTWSKPDDCRKPLWSSMSRRSSEPDKTKPSHFRAHKSEAGLIIIDSR